LDLGEKGIRDLCREWFLEPFPVSSAYTSQTALNTAKADTAKNTTSTALVSLATIGLLSKLLGDGIGLKESLRATISS
jgi:hypothetical protein